MSGNPPDRDDVPPTDDQPTEPTMSTRRYRLPGGQQVTRVPPPIGRRDVQTPPPRFATRVPPPLSPEVPAVEPTPPHASGLYFPWWTLLLLILSVGVVTCGIWGALYAAGGIHDTAPGRTPTIIIITEPPSPAPTGEILPTEPPTPTVALPTPEPTSTLPPGEMTVGGWAQVVGTGSLGLSMRAGPGTDYAINYVAAEGETFIVMDGPQYGSGEEWWYIVDPENSARAGWSARRYLQPIPPPQ